MKKEKDLSYNRKIIRRLCTCVVVFFLLVLIGVIVLFAVYPKREMSERENRVLAQRPVLTFSSVADGSFMKNFENWLSDQFPFRDTLISLKTSADRLTGKKEENGVYIGNEGFLFEKQTVYNEKQVKAITDAMNAFAKKNKSIKASAVISPNSSLILSDLMPKGTDEADQKEQLSKIKNKLSGISWTDCQKAFENAEDKKELFYRTDHHWTTKAAYLAFGSLMKTWKLSTKGVEYSFYTVSNDFSGTLSSSSGVSSSKDEIQICVPKNENHLYTVHYESSGEKTASLFNSEKLEQKNQYEVFLGGNFDKVIVSTNAETDRQLLIFKDSYANCMISMLTPYFSKIVIIDPRYYSGSLSSVLEEYEFTHAAFIYNLNTFLADTSLADTLES
ncbi:MAG: DHHW family protein [Acutalibacteraceae bacterium]